MCHIGAVNNFPKISLDFVVKMGYIIPMIKNGKKQNVVSTTRKQNLAAAKACDTYNEAVSLFRALQHANDMGTHGGDFNELETFFIEKQGVSDYVYNGFKKD